MKRSHILALFIVAAIAAGFYLHNRKSEPPNPRGKQVLIYPQHTVCEFFDMSKSGYTLIKNERDRRSCKGVIVEMETSQCFYKYGDEHFGEAIMLRHEWCMARRWR